jgi:uncharacterized protein (DUF58 family)
MNAAPLETGTGRALADANVIEAPCPSGACARLGLHLPREGALWLMAVAVMFVTGLVKGVNLLTLLACLLAGLWLVNYRLVRRGLKRLRGRRQALTPIFVGQPAEFELELETDGPAQVRGLCVEERCRAGDRRWLVLRLTAASPVRIRYQRSFSRYGRYVVSPLMARTQFPFGLVGRAVELAPAVEWLVLPRLGSVDPERLRHWLARSTHGDGRLRRRLRTQMQVADVHGLRDFRPGDSPRWIHWRSSARRNRMLVREFEESGAPDLVLVVEPWLPQAPTAEDEARLERLISMAGTVCHDWCRDLLSRLTLIILGPEPVRLPTGGGLAYGRRALETLALQDGGPAGMVEPGIDEIAHLRSKTPILVLTSRPSSQLAEQIEARIGRPAALVHVDDPVHWHEAKTAAAS